MGNLDASDDEIVPLTIMVTKLDRRRLRQLALDTNLSLQRLGHEAWNMMLERRGLPKLYAATSGKRSSP